MTATTHRLTNKTIIVDTGALMTALLLNFVRMMKASREKQQKIVNEVVANYFHNSTRLQSDYLSRFSKEIRPLRTTAHVIAEIHGRARSRLALHGEDLCSFWRHSFDFMLGKDLDESLVKLIDLRESNKVVCEIGVIDAAIIHLTHKEGGVLLSTDHHLMGRAQEQGVAVISEYEFACGEPIRDRVVAVRKRR